MGSDAEALPQSASSPKPATELYPMSNWKYDSFLWCMSVFVDLFFREVHPRGSWKVPRQGPILFVAAPHANQVSTSSLSLPPPILLPLAHELRLPVALGG